MRTIVRFLGQKGSHLIYWPIAARIRIANLTMRLPVSSSVPGAAALFAVAANRSKRLLTLLPI
jgi:hypothetical protein